MSDLTIARVATDLSLDREFDYSIPNHMMDQVALGSRVRVPFHGRKILGFVVDLVDTSDYELKPIAEVIGDLPLIVPSVMKLARWMAEYYAAPLESAMCAVLPSAVRRDGASFRKKRYVSLGPGVKDKMLVASLSKRRRELLHRLPKGDAILLNEFMGMTRCTRAVLNAMAEQELVEIIEQDEMRDPLAGKTILPTEPMQLMEQQQNCYRIICEAIDCEKSEVVLLHGVTASGKTEVYLQTLAYALEKDCGAIILVPEISLTPQTVGRFRSRFGDRIAVLHSHLSDGERHDQWHRLHRGDAKIAIGARSALFAPVRNLGLIVVDEEHEGSYKQDKTPHYNARDLAVMRGHFEKCAVVLGSATPSLESFRNVELKKYKLAEMTKRIDGCSMPTMHVVDMRAEREQEGRKGHLLSAELMEAMTETLRRCEQVILFLNRRGFASALICPKCGYVAECPHCSTTLTFHKSTRELRCHICDKRDPAPRVCPNPDCRDPDFSLRGVGTQRVEEVVQKCFPRARIARMDADTTTRKDAYEKILGAFRGRQLDILIGTQMIAKGLDFPHVTLVGVINADSGLHIPDFRAGERTFQLLTQVAGRAGRGEVPGEVYVQTYTPFHAAIQCARNLDFDGFADQELAMREDFEFPPYTKLASVIIRGKDDARTRAHAQAFTDRLRLILRPGVSCAGPNTAPLAKAKNYYRYQLVLRSPSAAALYRPLKRAWREYKWPRDIHCSIDIDAYSLL